MKQYSAEFSEHFGWFLVVVVVRFYPRHFQMLVLACWAWLLLSA